MSCIELPKPGSVWRHTKLNRQMRVVYSEISEIVAHDAERAHQLEKIVSWVGTPEEFSNLFIPGDETTYPKSASL